MRQRTADKMTKCGVTGTKIIEVFCCVAECLIAPPRYPDIVSVTTRPLPLPPVYPSTALPRPYPLFAPSRSAIQLLTGGVATETSTGEISINFRVSWFVCFLLQSTSWSTSQQGCHTRGLSSSSGKTPGQNFLALVSRLLELILIPTFYLTNCDYIEYF